MMPTSNFYHAQHFELQATLPHLLFRFTCLCLFSFGDGILVLVSLELDTYISIVGLPVLFNIFAELGTFSSGIGFFGRSKVDQLRRRDLALRGPTVQMYDHEFYALLHTTAVTATQDFK